MFFTHFHLTEHPFAENPKTEAILCDERFEKALDRLRFFQQTGNLALIVGQTGAGKSSLLRLYKQGLPKNRCRPVCLHMTHVGPNALFRMIVAGLGESPKLGKDRMYLQLADRLEKTDGETLLIIDEAHLLPSPALTDLRLLISAGTDAALPMKVVLCGQDPLAAVLKRSAHADLKNRICVRVRLNPLTPAQTAAYIDHRLGAAGGSAKIFDAESKALIHEYSGGLCRQINNIATACLVHAHSKNMKFVNEIVVNEIMSEFHF
jgi:general secretion pathway protein A